MTPCFGETCYVHLQGRRISKARNQLEVDNKQSLAYSSTLKMKATCSAETSLTFNEQHDVITQKIPLFS
jgi:hypothetical protein